jgi:uncharacterized protein (UPF0305 family)
MKLRVYFCSECRQMVPRFRRDAFRRYAATCSERCARARKTRKQRERREDNEKTRQDSI